MGRPARLAASFAASLPSVTRRLNPVGGPTACVGRERGGGGQGRGGGKRGRERGARSNHGHWRKDGLLWAQLRHLSRLGKPGGTRRRQDFYNFDAGRWIYCDGPCRGLTTHRLGRGLGGGPGSSATAAASRCMGLPSSKRRKSSRRNARRGPRRRIREPYPRCAHWHEQLRTFHIRSVSTYTHTALAYTRPPDPLAQAGLGSTQARACTTTRT